MQTNTLDRRIAAWLLTLPGPWSATSRADAARKARRMFDASMSDQEFEVALGRAGYAITHDGDAMFGIVLASEAAPHRDAA